MKKIVFVLSMLMVLGFSQAHAITYNDGAVHNINTAITEIVKVESGSTVNVLSDGNVLNKDSFSAINSVNGIVNVMGGTISGEDYNVTTGIYADGSSIINISDGLVKGSGPWYWTPGLWVAGATTANITGGVVEGSGPSILAYGGSRINISGGVLNGIGTDEIMAYDNSTFYVYGTNFDYTVRQTGGIIDPGEWAMINITGTLLDGTIIDWGCFLNGNGRIVLMDGVNIEAFITAPSYGLDHGVPEPASMLLLGLGLIGLAGLRRKIQR